MANKIILKDANRSPKVKVKVRQATRADIEKLVELNRLSYPTMAEENVVWGEGHLLAHQRVFPQGQLVAEVAGKIVGACCSLIVSLGEDNLRAHTWAGITDSGYFYNHNPAGDSLYGADVYVHPDSRGLKVGHALYEARRDLCKKLNLKRIIAGGRIVGYHKHKDEMTPEEYVARVDSGELNDPVLSFQLKEGFSIRGVIKNYLMDPLSMNCASFIEWLNPDYQIIDSTESKVRIACIQYKMRKVRSFKEFAEQVTYFVDISADYKSDFVLLPEFYSVQLLSQLEAHTPQEGIKKLTKYTPKVRKLIKDLAVKYGVTIIGGSHPVMQDGKIYNVCMVGLPNGDLVEQPKLHITPNERKWWGVSGGTTLRSIDTPKARIGVLICYDVEFPEAVRYLADDEIEILFVPFCTDNRQGYLRVRYCAHARAIENQIYVALTGNVGNLPDVENMDVQYGQAAVLTPSDFAFARDGIAAEADSNEETVLICDVDLASLKKARSQGTVTPRLDRRPDMFELKAKFGAKKLDGEKPLGIQIVRGSF